MCALTIEIKLKKKQSSVLSQAVIARDGLIKKSKNNLSMSVSPNV